ncbi:hypothetical protein N8311_00440, partial [bacterium]|nr:hypothetical protein [bacterium]
MIKVIIIFFTISLYGCNISSKNSKISEINYPKDQNLTISSTYLTANYSISKGDVYTASKILNANTNQLELLKLKFISNLISGNFEYAHRISVSLNDNEKKEPVYEVPKLAISLYKNDLKTSLYITKKIGEFLHFNNLTHLIEFWLFHLNNKPDLDLNNVSHEISIY